MFDGRRRCSSAQVSGVNGPEAQPGEAVLGEYAEKVPASVTVRCRAKVGSAMPASRSGQLAHREGPPGGSGVGDREAGPVLDSAGLPSPAGCGAGPRYPRGWRQSAVPPSRPAGPGAAPVAREALACSETRSQVCERSGLEARLICWLAVDAAATIARHVARAAKVGTAPRICRHMPPRRAPKGTVHQPIIRETP